MEFLKLNISLFLCQNKSSVPENPRKPMEDINLKPESQTSTQTPLLKNVLGDELYTSLQDFFKVPSEDVELNYNELDKDNEDIHEYQVTNGCNYLLTSSEFMFTEWQLVFCIVSVSLVLGLTFVVFFICSPKASVVQRIGVKVKQLWKSSKDASSAKEKIEEIILTEDDNSSTAESKIQSNSIQLLAATTCETNEEKPIVKIFSVSQSAKRLHCVDTDILKFLEETTNKLFSKLDRLLLKGASSLDQTQSAIATPRLARRPLSRRQRIGSSPSLPLHELSSEERNRQEKSAFWEQLKLYSTELGITPQKELNINSVDLDRNTQKLVHYFQRVCPISKDIWKATTLVVNYALFLIKSELENLIGHSASPIQFIKFEFTGSVKNGTKVSRVNTFDLLMHVQMPITAKEVVHDLDESCRIHLPPGMVLLTADKVWGFAGDANLFSSMNINGENIICLSSKQFLKSAMDLIDECLHSLYGQTSTAMERLPFQIRRAPISSLQLNVVTRALVGLGETEVKLNITPVLSLPTEGVLQYPVLYAAPVPEIYELPVDVQIRNSIKADPNFLWQLKYDDFESVFNECIGKNMLIGNVNSCYLMCLMILKAVLTGCNKNSLLDRGVLPENHISTILNFLLLESIPEQWTYNHLGDRFSDVIHFIREAYSNGRLPAFFLNNPHLAKKMPSVARNALLKVKRQQNLLIDWSRENLDKCLDYLKDRLREVGLADCVKEEYSEDMWEFEFFVFN